MFKNKPTSIVVLSVLIAVFIFGSGIVCQAAPKKGGTIIEAMGTEPTNLDPFKAARRPENTILHLIFEPLVVINDKLTLEPLLAESWSGNDDKSVWDFKLKQGITFHDGTPLNAEAVKFSMEAHKKGSGGKFITVVKEVKALDENTVRFVLSRSYQLFPNDLANFRLCIVSPTAVKKAGNDWGSKIIAGTGPLKFDQWISGDRVILKRFDDYHHAPSWVANKGPAYVDTYVIRFIPEPATLIAELTNGEVDLSDYVTGRDVKRVQQSDAAELYLAKSTAPAYLAINCDKNNYPYTDVRVRQAVSLALNKKAIIKAALAGVGDPLYTPLAPTVMGFDKESEEQGKTVNGYDPERAKKLLEEAGWTDTNGDGIREKEGQELDCNFIAFTIVRFKRIAEVATPMLQAVGFKVKTQILEPGDLYERTLKFEHDLLATSSVGSQGNAIDDLVSTLHSKSIGTVTQWSCYQNPEMDKLLDDARYQADAAVRAEALKKAQMLSVKDQVVAPICNAMEIFGYKKTLGGVDNYLKHPWCFNQVDAFRGLELWQNR